MSVKLSVLHVFIQLTHTMIKKFEQHRSYSFAILLFLYILSFMLLWDKVMSEDEVNISDRRWMIYSLYLLSAYSVYVCACNLDAKIKGIHIVVFLWCICMPFIILYNKGALSEFFLTILWPLLFETSYFIVRQDRENILVFRNLFIIVSLFGAFFFIQSRIDILSQRISQTNTVYFAFLTLPWFLLSRRKSYIFLFLILFTVMGIWSIKRLIILSIIVIWLFCILLYVKGKLMKKIVLVILLLLSGFFGYNFADNALKGELSERINAFETDEGGSRLPIYQLTWAMIQSSSTESMILGHGHNAVRKNSILEFSAHNDFLEVMYDYGLVIFILYLGLFIYVFRRCFSLYKIKSALAFPYTVSLIIFLVMSMVSHLVLYATYFNYLVVFWGSVEGLYYKKIRMKSLIDR